MRMGLVAAVGFVATILLANWLVATFGVVPVGLGLVAPAAVYAVGLALTLRDVVQDRLGRAAVFAAVLVGGGLSLLVSTRFAVASAVAFLVSETVDLLVFTPLRERSWSAAVVASNTAGALVDSWVFLSLSGLGLGFFVGQVVGKLWITLATVVAVGGGRAVLARYA